MWYFDEILCEVQEMYREEFLQVIFFLPSSYYRF